MFSSDLGSSALGSACEADSTTGHYFCNSANGAAGSLIAATLDELLPGLRTAAALNA